MLSYMYNINEVYQLSNNHFSDLNQWWTLAINTIFITFLLYKMHEWAMSFKTINSSIAAVMQLKMFIFFLNWLHLSLVSRYS